MCLCHWFQIEEEEKKLNAAIEEAEKQYSAISSEMKDLEIKSKEFEELEERSVYLSIMFLLLPQKFVYRGQDAESQIIFNSILRVSPDRAFFFFMMNSGLEYCMNISVLH